MADRKYFQVPESLVVILKTYAGAENVTLHDYTDRILEEGLGMAGEGYAQGFIKETIGTNPDSVRFMIPRGQKSCLVVSRKMHEEVGAFAREKGIRQIKLRTQAQSLPEMKALAIEISNIMKQQAPKVFGDL